MRGRIGRRGRSLDSCDVMMTQSAVALAAVEAHWGLPGGIGATGCADLTEAEQLGPETMRLLDVANVEDEVIKAAGCLCLGFGLRYGCHGFSFRMVSAI